MKGEWRKSAEFRGDEGPGRSRLCESRGVTGCHNEPLGNAEKGLTSGSGSGKQEGEGPMSAGLHKDSEEGSEHRREPVGPGPGVEMRRQDRCGVE